MTTYYKQCHLEKKTKESISSQVAWIPEKFAKAGNVIKIKNDDNTWVDGWVVKSFGETRIEEDDLPDSHAAVKSHRKRTGDAMPKEGFENIRSSGKIVLGQNV